MSDGEPESDGGGAFSRHPDREAIVEWLLTERRDGLLDHLNTLFPVGREMIAPLCECGAIAALLDSSRRLRRRWTGPGLRRGRGDRLRASHAPKPRLAERVAPRNEHGISCPGENLAGAFLAGSLVLESDSLRQAALAAHRYCARVP